MHTGCSLTVCRSLLPGGGGWSWSPWISPLDVGLDLIPLNFPLGCGSGSDPPKFPPWVWAWIWSPQFPPWVWAWTWYPWISPLGEGLEGGSPCQGGLLSRGVSLVGGSAHGGYPSMHWGRPCPVNRMTDRCKNITLATTSLRPVIILFIIICPVFHVANWLKRPTIILFIDELARVTGFNPDMI